MKGDEKGKGGKRRGVDRGKGVIWKGKGERRMGGEGGMMEEEEGTTAHSRSPTGVPGRSPRAETENGGSDFGGKADILGNSVVPRHPREGRYG